MKINAKILHTASGHTGAIYALTFNKKENIVFTGSGDGMVVAWSAENGEQLKAVAKNDSPVFSLYFNDLNNHIYIGDQSGYLHVVDTENSTLLWSSKLHDKGLYASVFHPPTNSIFTGGGDGLINKIDAELFHLKSNSLVTSNTIREIQIDKKGERLLIGSSDHHIHVVNPHDTTKDASLNQHKNSVFTICSINDEQFLSSGRDAEICVWSIEDDLSFSLDRIIPAHMMTINSIQISPNKMYFASVSRDKTVKIWRAADQKLLKVLSHEKFADVHTHSINDVVWTDNSHFITAGDDKRLVFWEIEVIED